MLNQVKKNGMALLYAAWGSSLKADKEVVLAAVPQYGLPLEAAAEALKGDKEVVLDVRPTAPRRQH